MDAKPAALTEGRGNESPASDSHDLHNRYFSSNPILLSNIDLFRARDLFFCVTLLYAVIFSLLGFNDRFSRPAVHLWHAAIWRLLHSVGLGIVLHRQSRDRWFVRHYFKHYFFKRNPAVAVVQEAFSNWTAIYNFSLTMTYVSFGLLALALAEPLNLARLSSDSLRLTGGVALIALHAWTARATYEVIGSFGWFVSLASFSRNSSSTLCSSMATSSSELFCEHAIAALTGADRSRNIQKPCTTPESTAS
jgi:hypothetical protein